MSSSSSSSSNTEQRAAFHQMAEGTQEDWMIIGMINAHSILDRVAPPAVTLMDGVSHVHEADSERFLVVTTISASRVMLAPR